MTSFKTTEVTLSMLPTFVGETDRLKISAMVLPVRPSDVTEAIETVGRLRRWIRERFGADHLAITAIRTRADQQLSGGYYVVVAAAPSRRIAPIDPALLIDVARQEAAALLDWTGHPTYAGGDTVRFERRDDRQNVEVALEMRSSGLLELVHRVALEPVGTEQGPRLMLVDVIAPIVLMTAVVGGRPFARAQRHRRRVDWYIGLTPSAVTPNGSVPWSGLAFRGEEPGGRATNARPTCPIGGFAATALRSRRRRQAPRELLELATRDLLVECGYFDFDNSVDDVIDLGTALPG